MTPTKIGIVEDNSGIRESLAVLINGTNGLRCVGTYANAEAALKNMPLNWPDVVLMDINLPRMSGIECVAKLKELRPTLLVIMLTVYPENEKIFQSLQAGATGYLLKESSPMEIVGAIHDALRGGAPMTNSIARKVVQYFQDQQRQQKPSPQTETLTHREQEVLSHLAKGYQYKEIAEALGISPQTISAHIRKIYDKLHVRSRTEAVVKFLGREGTV
jgi:DNA-binding NarL/FixJ family response regulator